MSDDTRVPNTNQAIVPVRRRRRIVFYPRRYHIPVDTPPKDAAKLIPCSVGTAHVLWEYDVPWDEVVEFCQVARQIIQLPARRAAAAMAYSVKKLNKKTSLAEAEINTAINDAMQVAGDTKHSLHYVIDLIVDHGTDIAKIASIAAQAMDRGEKVSAYIVATTKRERTEAGTDSFLEGRVDDPINGGFPLPGDDIIVYDGAVANSISK